MIIAPVPIVIGITWGSQGKVKIVAIRNND
jgi:adenylosuccinate synthase